jgi:hypothetical protein
MERGGKKGKGGEYTRLVDQVYKELKSLGITRRGVEEVIGKMLFEKIRRER